MFLATHALVKRCDERKSGPGKVRKKSVGTKIVGPGLQSSTARVSPGLVLHVLVRLHSRFKLLEGIMIWACLVYILPFNLDID
jgi:hypothetical protein